MTARGLATSSDSDNAHPDSAMRERSAKRDERGGGKQMPTAAAAGGRGLETSSDSDNVHPDSAMRERSAKRDERGGWKQMPPYAAVSADGHPKTKTLRTRNLKLVLREFSRCVRDPECVVEEEDLLMD
jgi:hypothetical protein